MTWVIALLEKSLDSVPEALGACGAAPGACTSMQLWLLRERTSFPPCDAKREGARFRCCNDVSTCRTS